MMIDAQRPHLATGKRMVLALLCVGAGVAPLAARWIPGDAARIFYGVLISALYFAFAQFAPTRPSLRQFREIALAFAVFALVQVLNNALPPFVSGAMLHDAPNEGDPLASTVFGTVVIQLL